MPTSSSQQWSRRIRYTDQHIRVSDAERNAVTERLAAHYGDGRLDQAEFDERVNKAMTAKTRGDLDGLFDDLPDPEAKPGTGSQHGPAVPYRPHRRGPARPILTIALVIALMIALAHAVTAIWIPWFWIIVLVVAIVFVNRSSRTRNNR
jgi:hypothetical protein